MSVIVKIENLSKTYDGGFTALNDVSLDIRQGEILALLGPNGAGKTTLISAICGIVQPSSGKVTVAGFDIVQEYRQSRQLIGLVPQELTTDAFESVINNLNFSRGLFGKKAAPEIIEKVLKDLSLWDKRDNKIMMLSGGMKRRLLIAKALCHEPKILFLDEPTAGVDVELRRDMWRLINRLRESGVTIILTTHYIEEAEDIADRIAVITKGSILLVEEKDQLMKKLGRKQLILDLKDKITAVPDALSMFNMQLNENGTQLIYTYDVKAEGSSIADIMKALSENDIPFKDLKTEQSSLEEIFVTLTKEHA